MTAARVLAVLEEAPRVSLLARLWAPARLAQTGFECEGSKFHNPRPLMTEPVDIADLLAASTEKDVVYLCAGCKANLTVYVAVRDSYDGATPQAVRRDFGNIIRDLGDRAWDHYVRSSKGTTGA